MNYLATMEEIKNYYANLLILQYHGKPKAVATIKTTVQKIMSDLIIFQIRDGFNILKEPYAVGKQLDVIGEWVGIDRMYDAGQPLYPWFSLVDWNNDYNIMEQDVFMGGFQDWNDPLIEDGGFLGYDDLILGANKSMLNDDWFLKLIKLKIIKNSSRHTMRDLDDRLYEFFDNGIYITWGYANDQLGKTEPEGMSLTFNYTNDYNVIIEIAKNKDALPIPTGMLYSLNAV